MTSVRDTRETNRFRRLMRFSLRTVVLLITIGGVCFALHMNGVKRQQALIESVKQHGGSVNYDFEFRADGTIDSNAKSPVPQWLLSILGYDHFHHVASATIVFRREGFSHNDDRRDSDELLKRLTGFRRLRSLYYQTPATDEGLESVSQFRRLRFLYLVDARGITDDGISQLSALKELEELSLPYNSQATDKSLQALSRLPKLSHLDLGGGHFSNAGLKHIQYMTQLRDLKIGGGAETQITDDGLIYIKQLINLENLDLQGADISERGLRHLVGLTHLRELDLGDTKIEDTSWLAKKLPRCTIRSWNSYTTRL